MGSADIQFNRHLRVRVFSAQPISFFADFEPISHLPRQRVEDCGEGASAMITAKRRSSSALRVVGGCLAVYALLATGYQYFLEPVTIGHAAVSKAIPQSVEAIAPAAAPSAVVPPPAAVELPRSDGAPMLRDPVRGGEQTSTAATSSEPASPVASEFAARAPEPTETPAVEKPKRPAKQAARSHGQPRNPLELVLRPFSALRLPF